MFLEMIFYYAFNCLIDNYLYICKVFNKTRNMDVTYHVVGSYETDPVNGKISDSSPIGSALLGARAGDEVVVEGARIQHLQIKNVTRAKEN